MTPLLLEISTEQIKRKVTNMISTSNISLRVGKKHLYLLSAQKGAHLRIVQVRLNAKSV